MIHSFSPAIEVLEARIAPANLTITNVTLFNVPEPAVPGDQVTVEIIVKNDSDEATSGNGGIHVYISDNNAFDGESTDPLIAEIKNVLSLKAHQEKIIIRKVKLADLTLPVPKVPAGDTFLIAELQGPDGGAIQASTAFNLVNQFGQVADHKKPVALNVVAPGGEIRFSMTGPGTGEFQYAGGSDVDLVFTGTDGTSFARAIGKMDKGADAGLLELRNITALLPMKKLLAPAIDVKAAANFSGGLSELQLSYMGGSSFASTHSLSIASGAGPATLRFVLGIRNTDITAAAGIEKLLTPVWHGIDDNGSGSMDILSTPFINKFFSGGPEQEQGIVGVHIMTPGRIEEFDGRDVSASIFTAASFGSIVSSLGAFSDTIISATGAADGNVAIEDLDILKMFNTDITASNGGIKSFSSSLFDANSSFTGKWVEDVSVSRHFALYTALGDSEGNFTTTAEIPAKKGKTPGMDIFVANELSGTWSLFGDVKEFSAGSALPTFHLKETAGSAGVDIAELIFGRFAGSVDVATIGAAKISGGKDYFGTEIIGELTGSMKVDSLGTLNVKDSIKGGDITIGSEGAGKFFAGAMEFATIKSDGRVEEFKVTGIKGKVAPFFSETNVTLATVGKLTVRDVFESASTPYAITALSVDNYIRSVGKQTVVQLTNVVAPGPPPADQAGSYSFSIRTS